MNWVQINKAHFNTDLITAFYWSNGQLRVYWLDATEYDTYEDSKRENYLRLCSRLGIRPIEEDDHGKK